MKQQCYLVVIYINWLLLICGVGYLLLTHRYAFAITWLVALPLAMWAYIRIFPSISGAMGYGKVDDDKPRLIETPKSQPNGATTVRIYIALGCPFCPIVEKRLLALQQTLPIEIKKIDVTLRPDLLASKGIRAVPVVEVEDRRINGNPTSEQLSSLILGRPALTHSK